MMGTSLWRTGLKRIANGFYNAFLSFPSRRDIRVSRDVGECDRFSELRGGELYVAVSPVISSEGALASHQTTSRKALGWAQFRSVHAYRPVHGRTVVEVSCRSSWWGPMSCTIWLLS